MKKIVFLAGMLSATIVSAQDFNFEEKANALGLPGTTSGSLAHGVVNGKKAVLVTGIVKGLYTATKLYLYNTDKKIFEEDKSTVLQGIKLGQAIFVDIDKDGDSDIALIGKDSNDNVYFRIYENNNGAFSVKQNLDNEGLGYASINAGDYNGDGYPDLLVSGTDNNYTAKTLVYDNQNGNFVKNTTIALPEISGTFNPFAGDAKFGHFNEDGKLDIVLAGADNENFVYFQNDSGTFTKSTQIFKELLEVENAYGQMEVLSYQDANIAVADISAETKNYQDFVIIGKRYGANSLAFGNDENYVFDTWGVEDYDMPKMDINNGKNAVILADFNGDNKPDMVFVGAGNFNGNDENTAFFYKNVNDGFSFFERTNNVLGNINFGRNGSVLAFDYDDDGDLDLLVVGEGNSDEEVYAKFFENKKTTLANNDAKINKADVKLYPNPVVSTFSISGVEKVAQVSVYDMSGRLVKSFSAQNEYNVSNLSKGNYIVVVKGDNATQKFTIVKK